MEESEIVNNDDVNRDDIADGALTELVDLLQNNGYGIAFVIPAKESWN